MPKFPATQDTLMLRYAQLEELVASLLDAHGDRKSPLSARFRLFRQRGFPPNVTTLGKTRFAYDLDAVLRVALAFWMMNAFVPQEVVPLVIERNWDDLKAAFRHAFTLIRKDGAELAAGDDGRMILLLSPRNLLAFSLSKDEKADPGDTVGLEIVTAGKARDRLAGRHDLETFAPVTVIDLHRLGSWVREAILASRWSGPEPFDAFGSD